MIQLVEETRSESEKTKSELDSLKKAKEENMANMTKLLMENEQIKEELENLRNG